MADVYLTTTAHGFERVLRERGLGHLHVRVYGKHFSSHSGEPGDGENRARLRAGLPQFCPRSVLGFQPSYRTWCRRPPMAPWPRPLCRRSAN